MGEVNERCPRRLTGEHVWRPGPVVNWAAGREAARYVALVCACGALAVRQVPRGTHHE